MENEEPTLQKKEKYFGDWFEKDVPKLTQELYPFKNLFSSISISNCEIKNRVVMGPISNQNLVASGKPTQEMIDFYARRAKGGVGLILTGNIQVAPELDPTICDENNLSKFEQNNFQAWKDLVDAVHAFGTKIFAELSCGFGRYGKAKNALVKFKLPISASVVPNYFDQRIPCSRISDFSLNKIIKKTIQAAQFANQVGFDGVCINGRVQGLVEQMSNSAFNKRKIGKFCKKHAFSMEIVRKIKQFCGKSYPILWRATLSMAIFDTYGDRSKYLKKLKNERTVGDSLEFFKSLAQTGVDAFDISVGSFENCWLVCPPAYMPPMTNLDFVSIVKEYFEENKILSGNQKPIVFLSSGKMNYPDMAENAICEEKIDMIMLSRALLADSDWANKTKNGDAENIRWCIGCNYCLQRILNGLCAKCAVNPEIDLSNNKVPKLKKVAVIGAGPAGIVASKILVGKGYYVDLYESTNRIGGCLNLHTGFKSKFDTKIYLDYLSKEITKLQNCTNFMLNLDKKCRNNEIKSKNYDCVIFANGAQYLGKNINGAVLSHVHNMFEALADPTIFDGKKTVAIVGKLKFSLEIAHYLAYEKNIDVRIILDSHDEKDNLPKPNQDYLLHYLEKKNVKIYSCCKIVRIEEGYVDILQDAHNSVNLFETWKYTHKSTGKRKQFRAVAVDADVVVLCEDIKPNSTLFVEACKQRIAPEIYAVGDASRCEGLAAAIRQAAMLAKEI